ncbi:ATP-dependent RNA helicase dbp7, partial [Coemansia furcata]
MADDDGLIFNFATTGLDTPVLTTHGRPKGGKWKDRMENRRKLKTEVWQSQKKTRETTKSTPAVDSSGRGREDKQQEQEVQKLLTEIGGSGNKTKAVAKPANAKPTNASTQLSGQAGKQVVSSLFTKNPEIPSLPEAAASHEHKVSSNAVIDTSSFLGIGLDTDMVSYLETKMEITKPTAIQQNAIPVLIGHSALAAPRAADTYGNDSDAFDVEREIRADAPEHDVFIQAATGSGKTLTYLLPIIHRLLQATATA